MFINAMPHVGDNILRLAVILKESNEPIGWVVSGMKDGVPSPNWEIAYGISNKYTGNGYGTEAAKGLINYLFSNTDTTELVAVALTDNMPSNDVIKNCEFQYQGILQIEEQDYYYRLINDKM